MERGGVKRAHCLPLVYQLLLSRVINIKYWLLFFPFTHRYNLKVNYWENVFHH